MFCVECGEEKEIYKNGVCLECFLKENRFTQGPAEIDLPVCAHCNSYKYKSIWTADLLNDVLRRIIKNTFKISPELKKIDINPVCDDKEPNMECKIYISGFIGEYEITEDHNLLVHLKKIVCDVCSKRFGGYHEAILQIRADKRDLTEEELDSIAAIVESHVQSMQAKGNRSVFVTDLAEEKGGIDFYLSDKTAAQTIIKKIHEEYGGEIKQSSKNIGMKDGKQLFRVTHLLRIPSFKKDDFIKLNNKYYKVKSLQTKKAKLISLTDWEETSIEFKNLKNASILGDKDLLKEMIVLSQTKNEIQLMDEISYNISVVKKPKAFNHKDKKISVLKIDDFLFINPK
jgi:nonsense-mediated mRNA decay protein 3